MVQSGGSGGFQLAGEEGAVFGVYLHVGIVSPSAFFIVGIKAGHGTSHKHVELVFLLIGLFWLRVYPQIFSGGIRVLAVVGRTG